MQTKSKDDQEENVRELPVQHKYEYKQNKSTQTYNIRN